MAEDQIIENDEDEELIPVEELAEDPRQQDDEEEDEHEDARLSDDGEDESDDDGDTSPNRKKRLKRRQVQRIAKENAQRELRLLREQNELLAQRLAAVEGNALNHNEMAIDTRISEAEASVRTAEQIIARAVESGNGEDVTAAMRMRDEALLRANQLQLAKQQITEAKNRPAAANPTAVTLAKEWMSANPWYDAKNGNEDSAITNAIDARLVAEGYNPATVDYWQELTRRVRDRMSPAAKTTKAERSEAEDTTQRKKAPPMGATREHAPQSTKKEVYVTPERKQAMIEAGIWEDPVRRNQMLKAYQAYDRNSAR